MNSRLWVSHEELFENGAKNFLIIYEHSLWQFKRSTPSTNYIPNTGRHFEPATSLLKGGGLTSMGVKGGGIFRWLSSSHVHSQGTQLPTVNAVLILRPRQREWKTARERERETDRERGREKKRFSMNNASTMIHIFCRLQNICVIILHVKIFSLFKLWTKIFSWRIKGYAYALIISGKTIWKKLTTISLFDFHTKIFGQQKANYGLHGMIKHNVTLLARSHTHLNP